MALHFILADIWLILRYIFRSKKCSEKAPSMESRSVRKIDFERWLAGALKETAPAYAAMTPDASFRSYYRVSAAHTSYVAMDAPPPENCRQFTAVAAALRAMGLNAPQIYSEDLAQGFLLLTDFGNTTFLRALRDLPDVSHADDLYKRALDALLIMQGGADSLSLPQFGREWLEREWAWHQEWFLQKWLGIAVPDDSGVHACYEQLILSALAQPQVFMHRDYHSGNLMVLPDRQVGILDFQDAFIGPLMYDPASLLRDCYIDWPETCVRAWLEYYGAGLRARGLVTDVSDEQLARWFDWMGLQRHLKALLTFARKSVRDHDARYLEFVPRTLNYIISVSRQYPEMQPVAEFYSHAKSAAERKAICAL
jgi:aminoglycoside/choline kinase family phosphotransferase